MKEQMRNYVLYFPPSFLNGVQENPPGLQLGLERGSRRSASPLAGIFAVAPGNHCFPPVAPSFRLAPPHAAPPPNAEPRLSRKSACPLSGGTSGQRLPRPPEGEVSPPNAPSLVRIRWRHVRRSPPSYRRLGQLPPRHLPLEKRAVS